MANRKLTAAFAKVATSDGKEREIYWDETVPNFGLMVTRGGHRSYVVQYRHAGRSRRLTLASAAHIDVDAARKRARTELGRVSEGRDPVAEKKRAATADRNTLKAVCEAYLGRDGKNLRTLEARRSVLERLVYPVLGDRQIDQIGRRDITHLLDGIEDGQGPAAANAALCFVRKVFNWHAMRDDEFVSPVVRGMARETAGARERTLTDTELRAVWLAAEKMGAPWSPYIHLLLLTAARRNEVSDMRWSELDGELWTIPAERYKTSGKNKRDMTFPLSSTAVKILREIPRFAGSDFVLTVSGRSPISNFASAKLRLDLASGVKDWRLHDLRRTARSLMSRAGVNADIAERCLGHVIGGVRGIYDRHRYLEEMRHAFEALAGLLDRIVHPEPNVIAMEHRTSG